MSDHDSSSKLEIATHASLPWLLMLFIQTTLNHFAAPANTIFLSPYLLSYFVVAGIGLIVLLKGQICPGQAGRLTTVLLFLLIFAVGNFIYSNWLTPRHTPMAIAGIAAIFLPLIIWKLPSDEQLYRVMIYCGLAAVAIGSLQYLAIYWFELPSMFNGFRANNFAQLQLGIVLGGWYLMLAKSRLDGFFKLLIKLALIALVMNYVWTAFVLYQHLAMLPNLNLLPFALYSLAQFAILGLLAWLLIGKQGKNVKNPFGWTVTLTLSMLYPLVNILI